MGESVVEAPNLENKKREASLEVSVSFGRFENDSLSWEKWSTFSPNKYLEEVGKCSTPGSVAQKKAYFEAHYKKIAARKAEETEQDEKQMVDDTSANHDQNGVLPAENTSKDDNKLGVVSENSSERDEEFSGHPEESNEIATMISPFERSMEEINHLDSHLEEEKSEELVPVRDDTRLDKSKLESDEMPLVVVQEDKHVNEVHEEKVELLPVRDNTRVDKSELESDEMPLVVVQEDKHVNEVHEEKVELLLVRDDTRVDKSKLESDEMPPGVVQEDKHVNEVHEEKVELASVSIQKVSHSDESTEKLESPVKFEKETSKLPSNRKEKAKLDAPNKPQKVNDFTKERNLGAAKKKPSSPLPRTSPEFSTPKTSKPTPISISLSSSRSSTKKANDSSSLRSKTNSTGVTKKVAPSAMHMSLNFEPANSEATSLPTTRKSLIMESMGDKDIVKRAFKQFQNNFNQRRALGDEKSTGQKASSATDGQNLSTSLTTRKENQGARKTAEKMDAQRAQLGKSWNATSVRSLRGPAMDKKSAKPAPSSSGLRSDEKAEKRKEAVKKSVEKPRTQGVEKTRLASKSKEEKETESSKLTRTQKSKASPLPGFGHGPVVKKNPLDKGGVKNERLHRPEMHR